jgi:hypothetical protein
MRRLIHFFIFISFSILLYSGCKKEKNDTPAKEDITLMYEQQIGPSGGTIGSNQDFLLNVPPGTFASTVNLQVYFSDAANPFGDYGASPLYYLKGLPDKFTGEVRVTMKHNGSATKDSYIGKGFIAKATSTFDTIFGTKVFPASDSSGFLISMIGPEASEMAGGFKNDNTHHMGSYGVPLFCIANYLYYQTDHFLIYFPSRYNSLNTIPSLAGGLEDAYMMLKDWGFTYDNRTSWPVYVEVKPIGTAEEGIDGLFNRSIPYTSNSGYIEINERIITDGELLRITGGHEFFHLVQDLYTSSDDYDWLREASSTWFEAYLTLAPDTYIPKTFVDNKLKPLDGLQNGAYPSQSTHGYGCSSVLKYQMTTNNQLGDPKMIQLVWTAAKQGKPPVEALQSFPMINGTWWPEFLNSYFVGNVYNDKVYQTLNQIYFQQSREFKIASVYDTAKELYSLGWNLSGEIFKITPSYNGLTDKSSLEIQNDGLESYMYIYRISDNDISLLGDAGDNFKIENLKNFVDTQDVIYILLAHWGTDPPDYEGYSPVTLKIKVIDQGGSLNYYQSSSAIVTCEHYSSKLNVVITSSAGTYFTVTSDTLTGWATYYATKMIDITFPPPPSGQTITFDIYVEASELTSTYEGTPEITEAPLVKDDKLGYSSTSLGNLGTYQVTVVYDKNKMTGYANMDLRLKTNSPASLEESIPMLGISFNPLKK